MRRDQLLVSPTSVMIGTDQGVAWVTDRYVMVRADLFTRPPKDGKPLLSRHIRPTLAPCRLKPVVVRGTAPFPLPLWNLPATTTGWRLTTPPSEPGLLVAGRAGNLLINERVARGLWAAGAHPYVTEGRMAWWQKRRGKPCLVAVQMPIRVTTYGSGEWEETS